MAVILTLKFPFVQYQSNTGSLFCLKNIICHFPQHVCCVNMTTLPAVQAQQNTASMSVFSVFTYL